MPRRSKHRGASLETQLKGNEAEGREMRGERWQVGCEEDSLIQAWSAEWDYGEPLSEG